MMKTGKECLQATAKLVLKLPNTTKLQAPEKTALVIGEQFFNIQIQE